MGPEAPPSAIPTRPGGLRGHVAGWLLVATMPGAMFLLQTANSMLGPLLPRLAQEFATSVAVVGQLASVTFLAWGGAALLLAPLSDSYGRRPVLLGALSVAILGVALSGFAWSYASLLALRVLTALAAGAVAPTVMATAIDAFPARARARLFGIMVGAVMLGPLVGVPMVATITGLLGWRWAFYVVAMALGLLLALFILLLPRGGSRGLKAARLSYRTRYRYLTRAAAPWLAMLGNLLLRVNLGVILTYVAAFLMDGYLLTEEQVALPLAAVSLGLMTGSLAGGEVARSRARLPVTTVALSLSGWVGLALFLGPWNLWGSVALGFLLGFLTFLGVPALLTLTAQAAGEHRGTMMGLFALSNQWGALVGAALGGLLLALAGFGALGFLCLGAALAASAVTLLLLVRFRLAPGVEAVAPSGPSEGIPR